MTLCATMGCRYSRLSSAALMVMTVLMAAALNCGGAPGQRAGTLLRLVPASALLGPDECSECEVAIDQSPLGLGLLAISPRGKVELSSCDVDQITWSSAPEDDVGILFVDLSAQGIDRVSELIVSLGAYRRPWSLALIEASKPVGIVLHSGRRLGVSIAVDTEAGHRLVRSFERDACRTATAHSNEVLQEGIWGDDRDLDRFSAVLDDPNASIADRLEAYDEYYGTRVSPK